MSVSLFDRVVPLRDFSEEGLRAGDVGTLVERHPATGEAPEGYEVEFFAATGAPVSVASVPGDAVRKGEKSSTATMSMRMCRPTDGATDGLISTLLADDYRFAETVGETISQFAKGWLFVIRRLHRGRRLLDGSDRERQRWKRRDRMLNR